MSDQLSQAEIDALLGGDALAAAAMGGRERACPPGWSPSQWAALEKALNRWLTVAWTCAAPLVGHQVDYGPNQMLQVQAEAALTSLVEGSLIVRLPFASGLQGEAYLMMPPDLAADLATALTGEASVEISEMGAAMVADALGEIMSRGLSSLEASLGMVTLGTSQVTGSPAAAAAALGGSTKIIMVRSTVSFGTSAAAVALAMPLSTARTIAMRMLAEPRPTHSAAPTPHSPPPDPVSRPAPPVPNGRVVAEPAAFPELAPAIPDAESRNMGMLMDVSLSVTVELGRTRRQIRDVLSLAPGAVLELEKLAGEPVDVLVNGKLIARGEVLVIGEQFGVRITEIISPAERAATLR